MGNILFLIGITLLLGPQRTFLFFARRQKWRGSAAFWAGIFLILIRWTFVGFLVECVGIFYLFGEFFKVGISRGKEQNVVMADSGYRQWQDSHTTSQSLDRTWREDCRLLETRLARMTGHIRICLYNAGFEIRWEGDQGRAAPLNSFHGTSTV
jgi:hypothetical protein